jgi:hypothetical protein
LIYSRGASENCKLANAETYTYFNIMLHVACYRISVM